MNIFKRKLKKACPLKKFTDWEYKEYFFAVLGWRKIKDDIKVYLN